MKDNHKEWTFDEFIAFMMVFAASSDDIDKSEKTLLTNELGKDLLKDMQRFVSRITVFQSNAIISDLKEKYIKTKEDVDNLFDKLDKVVKADGEVNFYEKQMLAKLHKIIDFKDK